MARLPLIFAGAAAVATAAVLIGTHPPSQWRQAQAPAQVEAAVPAEAAAPAAASAPMCSAPAQLTRFTHPLPRLADRVAHRAPITIVAVGSSSTAGTGASSSAATYPARLEALLRERAAGAIPITVLNRGVGGEEIREMLARFEHDVIAPQPDLVLWQVGTNSVLHDHEIGGNGALLAGGLARLKATGADVVVINPQYAPKVLAHPAVAAMVDLISATTKASNVQVFDRFAVMKYWRDSREIPFEAFLCLHLLHMNDWGYDCVAQLLANAIADAAGRAPLSAGLWTMPLTAHR